MIGGRVGRHQDVKIGLLEVVQPDGGHAGADGRREPDAAGLVAIEGAVVDVVRAEQPRQQLQQEAGFVRRASAGVEKAARGSCLPESRDDLAERGVPGNRLIAIRAGGVEQGLHEAAAVLQARAGRARSRGRSDPLEEFGRIAPCMSEAIACTDFLQTSGKWPAFVHHSAEPARPCPPRTSCRRFSSAAPSTAPPADAVRESQRVTDGLPSATALGLLHPHPRPAVVVVGRSQALGSCARPLPQ